MNALSLTLATWLSFSSLTVFAENLPANHCEVYISKVEAVASSHGSGGVRLSIQTGFIGKGETIQKVGYYGTQYATDLGNNPNQCHWGLGDANGVTKTVVFDATHNGTRFGEYTLEVQTQSGSVVSECPGYHYSLVASFFVETNKNTYWVNPSMDKNQYFVIDENGYQILGRDLGMFQSVNTVRPDLNYYNPLKCSY